MNASFWTEKVKLTIISIINKTSEAEGPSKNTSDLFQFKGVSECNYQTNSQLENRKHKGMRKRNISACD